MKILSVNVRKLEDRSKRVVYLGREPGIKACCFYDPKAKKIWVTRDVVIEEKKTRDWENEDKEMAVTTPQGSFIVPEVRAYQPTKNQSYEEQNKSDGENDFTDASDQVSLTFYDDTPSTGGNDCTAESNKVSSNLRNESLLDGDSSETTQFGSSEQPRKFKMLSDIYDNTEIIELDEEELMLLGVEEPNSFDQAVVDQAWRKAMEVEIDAIERNRTWKLVELLPGHKAIGVKWDYKLKRDADGNVVKYKARLVPKGYVQKQGVDFEEVYDPIARLETVKLLLALAAKNQWEVHHMDVKSAFLNGEL
ncbi:uncharacterized protein LOC141666140 [Apium graveolens]|uniref:uncharacterized protein LOC141666140 n=1 Tax=Apium graveolens TaxID=4045 RepID=UPI003D7BE4A9